MSHREAPEGQYRERFEVGGRSTERKKGLTRAQTTTAALAAQPQLAVRFRWVPQESPMLHLPFDFKMLATKHHDGNLAESLAETGICRIEAHASAIR